MSNDYLIPLLREMQAATQKSLGDLADFIIEKCSRGRHYVHISVTSRLIEEHKCTLFGTAIVMILQATDQMHLQ